MNEVVIHFHTTREQFLEMLPKEIKSKVEEILCALYILDCSVEFDVDRYVYHYEPTFRFTTNHGRFSLGFKFWDVEVLENITFAGMTGKSSFKRISSFDDGVPPMQVLDTIKKYL